MNFILLPLPNFPKSALFSAKSANKGMHCSIALLSPLAYTTRSRTFACAPVPLSGQSSAMWPAPLKILKGKLVGQPQGAEFGNDPFMLRGSSNFLRNVVDGLGARKACENDRGLASDLTG